MSKEKLRSKYLLSILMSISVMLIPSLTFSQNNRPIDGFGNNTDNPNYGTVGDIQIRLTPPSYADGFGEPLTGEDWDKPNPRAVSNYLFAQDEVLSDPLFLSDFTWVFGQFIDHDITLVENGHEPFFIPVPEGDEFFQAPFIPMVRNEVMPGTGTDVDNPRQYSNHITAYLDGSAIYGSDAEREAWLRTYSGGKLKMSSQNLLPWNTIDGEFNSSIDVTAPFMGDDTGTLTKMYVAGDVRANENPLLLAFHTLFAREHNYQCDIEKAKHPGWNDERIYQAARKTVISELQHITYNEWLPALGIELAPYSGYKSAVQPRIFNEFSAAAFRMGHTLINSDIIRMDNSGEELSSGNISLRDAFFNPSVLNLAGGIEPYLKGMATQVQQDFDCKVIDDVRNFLFGEPGEGGLDLAAININRGRDRGLADFNSLRMSLGLPMYNNFLELTDNHEDAQTMEDVYGDINTLDAWVGMLAEKRDEGQLFGKVVSLILERQFQVLRDGDRFYYENDVHTQDELDYISNTTMRDIIMRNTDITLMQDEVFRAMPHEDIEQGPDLIPFALAAGIYPNPVNDVLQLKVYNDADETMSLQIIDYLGKTVLSRSYQLQDGSNFITIDLDDCPRGYYNVVLDSGRRYRIMKMIKR